MPPLHNNRKIQMNKTNNTNIFPLINKYEIDVSQLQIISKYSDLDINLELEFDLKCLIVEKLLEAYSLAKTNVACGNITGRGFATNVCTDDNIWSLGTNFNNTRNDISSICGERSAILSAYNQALIKCAKNENEKFDFKIKYLCMSSNHDLNDVFDFIIPCEDCLSWLNTNRYFDKNAIIFSFQRDGDGILKITSTKLVDLLPYKTIKTSNKTNKNKKIKITNLAADSIKKFNLSESLIDELINKTIIQYSKNKFSQISNQNIAASIVSNGEIFSASKLDWTKRWHVEPLEFACYSAILKQKEKTNISAICYFGDEFSSNKFNDGVVSVKSLGRIRQKYASKDTILILSLENEILITTLGEFLPKKFIQGYRI